MFLPKIKCKHCGVFFDPSRNDSRIKYCSNSCKDSDWRIQHPLKFSEYNKKCCLSKILSCHHCGEPIPNKLRKPGVTLCSDMCRNKSRKQSSHNSRVNSFLHFHQFKINTGCNICGYNKYGGSLDFHHIDPSQKDIRISATHWKSQSSKILKEMSKCVLVCKNCHHELHHLMRHNKKEYNILMSKIFKGE